MTRETTRSPLELFAAAIAVLLPVAYTPGLEGQAWTARSALLLLVVAVGLPVLWRQARGQQPLAARAAIAFLLVGAASALLSPNPTTAVFGLYNQGTGLLFMASLSSAWAIGSCVSLESRPLIERALIVGVVINAVVAVVACLLPPASSAASNWFDPSGRVQALAGNPVHLAALAVLGLALIVPRFATSAVRWALPVAALAAAVELSGTRLALLVMLGMVMWAGRRHGVRAAATLGVVVILGLAAGSAIVPSANSGATQRATSTQDWKTRPATWLSARHSIAAHPLLGIGPGQFRTATSPYRPVSVALAEGSDKLFTDAHNLFVEYLTTTGILGLAALAVWLVAAIRPARGWLLVGAVGVLAIHLAEPQSVITTPLMFLALGAAAGRRRPAAVPALSSPPDRALRAAVPAGLVALAVAAAAVFLVAEFDLAQGQLDLRASPVQQANRLLPAWPRPASLLARVRLFEGITGHRNGPQYQESRAWRVVAIHRDDTDPALWSDLAEYDASRGRNRDAAAEFLQALRLNPTSARAMDGLGRLAQAACDPSQAALWHARSVRVAPLPAAAPGVQVAGTSPEPLCAGQHA
ncbi:MAG TPA: O-antigen ligase family protein [Acidimicrobiales bacterium]|jgi:O-antigen ligase|nr:O-antigen ligase family protein [Acidimicrobiales bacterium]